MIIRALASEVATAATPLGSRYCVAAAPLRFPLVRAKRQDPSRLVLPALGVRLRLLSPSAPAVHLVQLHPSTPAARRAPSRQSAPVARRDPSRRSVLAVRQVLSPLLTPAARWRPLEP